MKTVKSHPKFEGWLPAALLFILVSLSVGTTSAALDAQTLLKQADLVYQGAFRLPGGKSGESSFDYGGSALAYNPANDSLFIVGHDWNQMVAEISIPPIVNSSQLSQLSTAKVLQPFTDATEGKMFTVDGGTIKIGGLMVYQGKLYVTAYSYYDGDGSQRLSHFARPITLSTKGQVSGPYEVGALKAGFVSGYMTQIPQAWQASLGGPAITGNCCLSIISRTSWGPAAFAFNPVDLGKTNPVHAGPLVYYSQAHPTLGGWNQTGPQFNGTTEIRGAVFPEGTNSLLYFGRHGIGPFCYGTGADCNDPVYASKGNHAYPYVYQVWAYDAEQLKAVKSGQKNPWDLLPYAVWNFELPFQNANRALGGAAYDPATQRIFIAQSYAETFGVPMIHVWKVGSTASKKTSSAPSAPTKLTVSDAAILTWSTSSQPNSSDVVEIERSTAGDPFVRIASVEAIESNLEDPTALGSVCYRVRAVNQTSASDFSNTACALVTEGADVVITLEDGLVPNLKRRNNDISKHVEITVGKSAKVIINGKVQ